MIKFVVAIPLLAHGLANFAGVMAFMLGASVGFQDRPWLFSKNVRMRTQIGRLWGVIWLASSAALVLAAVGLFSQEAYWREAALTGCGLSLLSIVPWWNAVVPGAKFGAVFDILMILFLLSPWWQTVI